jgi:hypothetical protein
MKKIIYCFCLFLNATEGNAQQVDLNTHTYDIHNLIRREASVINELINITVHDPDERNVVFSKKFSGKSTSQFIALHFSNGRNSSTVPVKIILQGISRGSVISHQEIPILPDSHLTSFWTDDLPGQDVMLEVLADKMPDRFELTIDKWLYDDREEKLESVRDPKNSQIEYLTMENKAMKDKYWPKHDSVVRLAIFDENERYPCSGFISGKDRIITAAHCIPSSVKPGDDCDDTIVVWFDYYKGSDSIVKTRCSNVRIIDKSNDIAELSLEEKATGDRPILDLEIESIEAGEDLFVIHYPSGRELSITRNICKSETIPERDAALPCEGDPKRIYHTCDTETGSSGAPIFNWMATKVVGIQTDGYLPWTKHKLNCGVTSKQINDSLK